MKKIAVLTCLLLLSQLLYARTGTGIDFLQNKRWKEILTLAKTENKLIFVDIYTEWCGPCKVMDREVFTQAKVGDAFNNVFINVKIDAEKGEGISLANRYGVRSYPSYLFINGEGKLIYRSVGSMSAERFLNVAMNAKDESKQAISIFQLEQSYPKNKKDKIFMKQYLERRTALKMDNSVLLDEYISLLLEVERAENTNLQLILDNAPTKSLHLGLSLETLKKHADKLPELTQIKKENITQIEQAAARITLEKAVKEKDQQLLKKVLASKKTVQESLFDNQETVLLAYYIGTQQKEKFLRSSKEYLNQFFLKASLDSLRKEDEYAYQKELNAIKDDPNFKGNAEKEAWKYRHTVTLQFTNTLYQFSKNFVALSEHPADLEAAAKWMELCETITSQDVKYYQNVLPFYAEINAVIQYKLGHKGLAISKIERVLSLVNTPAVQKFFHPLLQKMNADEKL